MMTPNEIREKLEWLSRTDPTLWPHGAEEHGFRLAPPLSEDELESACRIYGIELPEEYRDFLLHVGNGGAGPGCGLERFGYVLSQSLLPHATAPGGIVEVQRDERGRVVSRSDVFDREGRKADWFDISFYNTMRDLSGDGPRGPRAPARPFPLAAPLDDDEDPFWQRPSWADGVWNLGGYGCGMDANLVLNGPFRGQVWLIDPNEGSYQPFAERASLHSEACPVTREKSDDILFTFAEWYEHWLDYAVLQVQSEAEAAAQRERQAEAARQTAPEVPTPAPALAPTPAAAPAPAAERRWRTWFKLWDEATAEEVAAEAERRVAEAAATGARGLDLGDLPLVELPAGLGGLGHLEALALGKGALVERDGELSFEEALGWVGRGWIRKRGIAMRSLAPLARLKRLRRLSLANLNTQDLSPLAELPDLEWLELAECPVEDLSPLAGLAKLARLDLCLVPATDLSPLAGLSRLVWLNLAGSPAKDFSILSCLTALEWLDLSGCKIKDLSPLGRLARLEYLDLGHTSVGDVSPLAHLPRLHTLVLEHTRAVDLARFQGGFEALEELNLECARVVDLSGLRGLPSLRSLDLFGSGKLADLSPLAGIPTLETLKVSCCRKLRDISPLAALPHLQSLDVSDTGVKEYSPLEQVPSLRSLDVGDQPIRSLAPLAKLRGLQVLDVGGCAQLSDLSPLESLTDLRELNLTWGTWDLSPLAKLERLEKLNLLGCRVADLSPLAGLKNLRALSLWSCKAEAGARVLSELSGLKELILFGFGSAEPCSSQLLVPLLDQLEYLSVGKSVFTDLDDLHLPALGAANDLPGIRAHFAGTL